MSHDEFLTLIKQPQSVQSSQIADLKEIVDYYPYFVQPRILLARALQLSKSVHAEKYVNSATIYSYNRRWLYYYLYPENKLTTLPFNFERTPKFSGNYFDLLENTHQESDQNQKKSLKNLAERLKAAREMVSGKTVEPKINPVQNEKAVNEVIFTGSKVEITENVENKVAEKITLNKNINTSTDSTSKPSIPAYFTVDQQTATNEVEVSESYVKDLIKERKYETAITVLNKLYLINPKKSIYFADQIRYLEKVIKYTKK